MREPARIFCDLCKAPIKDVGRAITIQIPLDTQLREQIGAALSANIPPGLLGLAPIFQQVPQKWTLETCGCVLQLIPDLRVLVADGVRLTLDTRAEQQRQSEVTDLEEL